MSKNNKTKKGEEEKEPGHVLFLKKGTNQRI